ncbi:hypothetical protein Nepgr_014944 [Nepenthes gracilis]|uniref:DOG1 domain-containing protein n=1 Tax=Nepenthes gracilis TaxID=150966 RepID=A0AAD3SL10_NEPGR|nr:hypothetical protein Nepgr_014944 [Nepenthes gracilis]
MAAAPYAHGTSASETFKKFFEASLTEQNQLLQELISATTDSTPSESTLRQLLDRVIKHYEDYYRYKSRWAKRDVMAMMTPAWRSSLEDAFLWIGGWRPSMAFHLLYSKAGLQLEAGLDELLRGLSTGDLGDLSPAQLRRVDRLQRETIRKERDLTETLAAQQETVADTSMVELSHAVTELIRNGETTQTHGGWDESAVDGLVESTLRPKEDALEEILHKADDLRLSTLKNIVEVLTPIQAVHFFIAATELHLRVHDWGKRRDLKEDRRREPRQ